MSSSNATLELPRRVRMVEVGPRDGLQNLSRPVATEVKVRLVDGLGALGFDRVEAAAFVSPRAVPQMADAAAVMAAVQRRPGLHLMALVPNRLGTAKALDAGADMLDFVCSASESFNQANLNQPIAASLASLAASLPLALAAGIPVRLTLSTSFGCPYEGYVDPSRVLDIAAQAADLGCQEICLGDTTGMANPRQVFELFGRLRDRLPQVTPAVHLHNTRGSGAANLLAALQAGVEVVDSSLGGLGGCPYAPGATGNVASEDMIHMLHEMDVETGVDLHGLIALARQAEGWLGQPLPGQVMRAGEAWAFSCRLPHHLA